MVMMLVLMVVATAAMLIMLMMMVMLFCCQTLHLHLCQFFSQRCLAFHCCNQLLTGQLRPGSGYQGCNFVVLTNQGNGSIQLVLCNCIGTGQNDGRSSFNLVVIELAKVLHVNLHLAGIADGNGVAQGHFVANDLLNCTDNIGQLANTGGLDDDAVRVVLGDHFLQSLTKVTHQATADTAGVHLGDVDASILQETAINANLAELIFNEHQLLALVSFGNHLLDQSGLTGTQKAGINVNFRHSSTPSVHRFSSYIIAPATPSDKKKIFEDSTDSPCFQPFFFATLKAGRNPRATTCQTAAPVLPRMRRSFYFRKPESAGTGLQEAAHRFYWPAESPLR